MESRGRINAYHCETCGYNTITVNACDGVTPFMIRCRRATIGCDGMATSLFYRVSQNLRPLWEWYRPDDAELAKMDDGLREHVQRGGLVLRKLDAVRAESEYGYRTRHG